jgi:hypothetical protein
MSVIAHGQGFILVMTFLSPTRGTKHHQNNTWATSTVHCSSVTTRHLMIVVTIFQWLVRTPTYSPPSLVALCGLPNSTRHQSQRKSKKHYRREGHRTPPRCLANETTIACTPPHIYNCEGSFGHIDDQLPSQVACVTKSGGGEVDGLKRARTPALARELEAERSMRPSTTACMYICRCISVCLFSHFSLYVFYIIILRWIFDHLPHFLQKLNYLPQDDHITVTWVWQIIKVQRWSVANFQIPKTSKYLCTASVPKYSIYSRKLI